NAPSMQATIPIGCGALESRLPSLLSKGKNFLLTDENVHRLYGEKLNELFPGVPTFVMSAGEENKNFLTLQNILSAMLKAELKRGSTLFAVGGGVVGDIGGFAASVYMRGIECVQIPTTLLAQVDSSVGGKTAIDFCGVKNSIGAFYQPKEVLIDPTFLRTLPPREIKCGLGEIVKYAALSKEIFDLLSGKETSFTDLAFLQTLITACVRHKAGVVERDEKECGERKSLNVGHTTGHAVELSFGLSHGESVLYGMALETRIAMECGACEKEYGKQLLSIVERALTVEPYEPIKMVDTSFAERAKSDKKNAKDGEIVLAVAKSKGAWQTLALGYEEYVQALNRAVNANA
ncbi:MAG: 3-dehydroquinate synthase, partial [Clostridia bacterium]|nr:3-dehydroquinate synthase [Clostridia bacterium]